MSTLGNFMSTGVYRDAPAINQAMGRVYAYMGLATLVSMLVSAYVGLNPELVKFFFTGIMHWVVMLAPLLFIFIVPVILNSDPPRSIALLTLCAFSGLMGLSLAVVFAVYTMASIVSAFMGAAVLFGVMSFYGYFTKQSLDSVGKYAFIALIAIIIVSIINMFIPGEQSAVIRSIISAIAILVFLALTAYDTQQIREMVTVDNGDSAAVEVMGALTLYLDFINLFVNLLQLFGVVKGSDD